MTLTVEIPNELESRLETEARRNGISKDEFVKVLLEEKLVSQNNERRRELAAKARIIASDLPVKDFSREHAWLEKNRDEYDGQYVALDGDKLIAHRENGREVVAKLRELNIKNPYLVFVEGRNSPRFISGGLWYDVSD